MGVDIDKNLAIKAFKLLDKMIGDRIQAQVIITVGGGGAMILLHEYQEATSDIDGIVNKAANEVKEFSEEIAKKLHISHDWLNPHFNAFTYYLPSDAGSRIENVFQGEFLTVKSLGVEDILIMKFMAGREKDRPHIKYLLNKSPNLKIIEDRLYELEKINKATAEKALEMFYEYTKK